MGDDIEALSKLSATLSTMIRQQSDDLQAGLKSVSAALDRAADRLSRVLPGAAGAVTAPAAGPVPAATAAQALPAGLAAAGPIMVLIANGDDRAVPVRMVAAAAAAPPAQRGGLFGSILGGIGSFIGGIVGGVAAGISAPVVAAELIVVLGEVIVVMRQLQTLLTQLRTSLVEIVNLVFDRLTQAGIFPISKLIAGLLVFVDTVLRLVLTYIKPILDWVNGLLTAVLTWAGDAIHGLTRWVGELLGSLADWVGNLLGALTRWLSSALPVIGVFLRDLLNFIMVTVVKPQLADLLSDLVRGISAVLKAFVEFLKAELTNAIIGALNPILSHFGGPTLATTPTGSLGAELEGAWRSVFPKGGTPSGAEPTLKLPDFTPPKRPGAAPVDIKPPILPEYQPPKPALGDILSGAVAASGAAPAPSATAPVAPPAAQPAAAAMQVSGGITVNINADRIDLDNAPATARLIAESLMEELQRLMDRDRFRRGLPGGAAA
jgi:hypothetical protein